MIHQLIVVYRLTQGQLTIQYFNNKSANDQEAVFINNNTDYLM